MNRTLRCLPLLTLALALVGCEPPTTCKDSSAGCIVPPPACDQLGEADCVARTDCAARYAETDCATAPTKDAAEFAPDCVGGSRVFVSCGPAQPVCPAVVCDLACTWGLARDAAGCEVCACSPVPCSADADCPAGESCLFPALKCAAGERCGPPHGVSAQGVCGLVDRGCDADADCAVNERCIFPTRMSDCASDSFCAPPRGTCKPAQGCAVDADCGIGRFCETTATAQADEAPCFGPGCLPQDPPQGQGQCRDRRPCSATAACNAGEVCAMDPNDPCVKGPCYALWVAQTFCLPGCTGLAESACVARTDCEAMYQPHCGNDPQPPSTWYLGCKPAGCLPVVCDLWCPNGYKQDATGCQTCACADTLCTSDADCQAGQTCVWPVETDCAKEDCGRPYLAGTCQWVAQGCLTDAECKPGETCVFPASDTDRFCDPSSPNCGARGTCQVVSTGCQVDADCAAGERCEVPVYDACPAGVVCPPLYGTCVPARCQTDAQCRPGEGCVFVADGQADRFCDPSSPDCGAWGVCVALPATCTDDSQCAAGERCTYDPMTNCGGASNCGPGQCVPDTCRADSDCRAGEHCLLPDCAPGSDCAGAGVCG